MNIDPMEFFTAVITIAFKLLMLSLQGAISDFRFIFNRKIDSFIKPSRCKKVSNRNFLPAVDLGAANFKGENAIYQSMTHFHDEPVILVL